MTISLSNEYFTQAIGKKLTASWHHNYSMC